MGIVILTSILAGCGSLALKKPETTDTFTSSEEAQAIREEEEAAKKIVKFTKTVQEFEKTVKSQSQKMDVAWSNWGFSMKRDMFSIEYKGENSIETEQLGQIYLLVDNRMKKIENYQNDLQQAVELVLNGLGEENADEQLIKKIIETTTTEIDYSETLGLDITRTNKKNKLTQIIFLPR